ncbi:uncharacterized protein At5g65660 [Silene latifolia]|uniref:uncharacterized protein At5g65660 n=1 Tax=Silene latifolia TaxID=37657 RepID=UPI003D7731EE
MESPSYSPVLAHHYHNNDASRPSLGFPLGTALLLIVIFSLSGIFSCCYHWDKFRALRQSYSDQLDLEANHPSKPIANPLKEKQQEMESVPVIMPGDHIAKFIAMPCPCEPPRLKNPAPVPTLTKPAKPPRFPVPLY